MGTVDSDRRHGLTVVTFVYLGSVLSAWVLVRWLPPGLHPLWAAAIADAGATVVVFGWSLAHDNSSMYDPYWSVAPLVLAPWLVLLPEAAGAVGCRQALVLVLVYAWGLRLTFNWARGWHGMRHEDWRYVDLRRSTGRLYWPVSLLGLHLMPTVMVFLGCLPLWPALVVGTAPLCWLDGVATLVCVGAVACEAVADRQLHEFRRSGPPVGAILDRGLWGWSRHPNYFGEITLWWGLFLFGLAAAPGAWWPVVGPLAITLLFVLASIPLIERRMHARRSGWAEHCRRVSALVPWPPRRTAR
jgi:steroid 5-alpha reductase family enzyme